MSSGRLESAESTSVQTDDVRLIFGQRLRAARERVGLSQERMAVDAGIDEFVASARISQYETGKHHPRFEIAVRLARVLDVPVGYLFTEDDFTAEMLLRWHALPADRRQVVLDSMR